MSMLGTMMERAGLVSENQAASARARSLEHRLPLLDAFLELALTDEDSVVAFFASKLLIPTVRPAILDRVDDHTLTAIPAELAHRYRVVPVAMDATRNLTVAMADPTDMDAVSAIATHTGAYLVRAVARRSAVLEALARHYGPTRAAPSDDEELETSADESEATQPAMRVEVIAEALGHGAPPPLPDSPALEVPESRHTVLGMPDSSSMPRAPTERDRAHTPSGWNPPLSDHDAEPTPLSPEAFARMLPRLVAAGERDDVTHLLLDFLGAGFARVLLFVNSRGELRGHDARGADLLVDAVKQVRIPAAEPSLFADVLASKRPYLGRMPATRAVDLAFAQALGGLPGNVLCLPVCIGEVVPLLLFAHGSNHPIDPRSIRELTEGVSAALQRIIAAKRRKG